MEKYIKCVLNTVFLSLFLLFCAADNAAGIHSNLNKIALHPGALIVAEGDSLTYGFDDTVSGKLAPINGSGFTRSVSPYPETLAADLGNNVRVENRGFPGDRSVDGFTRWQGAKSGQLALIMYGTNDYGNFGHNLSGTIDADTYRKTLVKLARRRLQQGAEVIIMTPPPLHDAYPEGQLQSYRKAAAEAADESGVYFFDTENALRNVPDPWIDGIHLRPQAYQAIAQALAEKIIIR